MNTSGLDSTVCSVQSCPRTSGLGSVERTVLITNVSNITAPMSAPDLDPTTVPTQAPPDNQCR